MASFKGDNPLKRLRKRELLIIERAIRSGRERKTKITKEHRYRVQDLKMKVALIQGLIPIALEAVAKELEREIERLVGHKHCRHKRLPGD